LRNGAPPPKTFQLEAQCSRNQSSADCQVNGFSPRLFVAGNNLWSVDSFSLWSFKRLLDATLSAFQRR